jgi:hypothetical protein
LCNFRPTWSFIQVKILQKALKQVDVDGDFGVGTDKRLKKVTGFNQITLNQYNQIIDKLQNIKANQLKEAKVKAEQKKSISKKSSCTTKTNNFIYRWSYYNFIKFK